MSTFTLPRQLDTRTCVHCGRRTHTVVYGLPVCTDHNTMWGA